MSQDILVVELTFCKSDGRIMMGYGLIKQEDVKAMETK